MRSYYVHRCLQKPLMDITLTQPPYAIKFSKYIYIKSITERSNILHLPVLKPFCIVYEEVPVFVAGLKHFYEYSNTEGMNSANRVKPNRTYSLSLFATFIFQVSLILVRMLILYTWHFIPIYYIFKHGPSCNESRAT